MKIPIFESSRSTSINKMVIVR